MKLVINRCIAQLIIQASVSSIINHRLSLQESCCKETHHLQSQEAPGIRTEGKDEQREKNSMSFQSKSVPVGLGTSYHGSALNCFPV